MTDGTPPVLEGRLPRRPRSGWNRTLHLLIEDDDKDEGKDRSKGDSFSGKGAASNAPTKLDLDY